MTKRIQTKIAFVLLIFLFSMVPSNVILFNKNTTITATPSDEWWNDNWLYRREISVENSLGEYLTNFQIQLELPSSEYIGKTQSDGSDIRLIDANLAMLDFWIEVWDESGTTNKIWVKITELAAYDKIYIYLYYGNNGEDSASNGYNTFVAWDDFEDYPAGFDINGINGWIDQSSDKASVAFIDGSKVLELERTSSSDRDRIYNIWSVDIECIVHFDLKPDYRQGQYLGYMFAGDSYARILYLKGEAFDDWKWYDGSSLHYYDPQMYWEIGSWKSYTYTLANNDLKCYDGSLHDGGLYNSYIDGIQYWKFDTHGTYNSRFYIDNFYVRKYISSEPIVSIGGEETNVSIADWTVMFYLAGDYDLTAKHGAKYKHDVLTSIGSDDQVQFISLVDILLDSKSYYCYYDEPFIISKSNLIDERNMGAEETLEDFINWGKACYPAHNYMVVLFDHGMGIMNKDDPDNSIGGICYERIDINNVDYLTPTEIKNALAGKNIDILGLDACLMGSSEIMYAIRNEVDYYVASEHIEPSGLDCFTGIPIYEDITCGWPYETIFPWLKNNPTATARSLASIVVDKYEESWGRIFDGEKFSDVTLSAIDTSYMNLIASQFLSFTSNLIPYIDTNIGDLYNMRVRCETYYRDFYIDLYNFLDEILIESALSSLHPVVQALQSYISNAVVNNFYYDESMAFSHGMSLYFPAVPDGAFWSNYLNTQWSIATSWGTFLESFFGTPFNTALLPDISSPADQYILVENPGLITWTANPKVIGTFVYEIYCDGNLVESGTYSQGSPTITYSFTAPWVPLVQEFEYKCRVYNSWYYSEDPVEILVVNFPL